MSSSRHHFTSAWLQHFYCLGGRGNRREQGGQDRQEEEGRAGAGEYTQEDQEEDLSIGTDQEVDLRRRIQEGPMFASQASPCEQKLERPSALQKHMMKEHSVKTLEFAVH